MAYGSSGRAKLANMLLPHYMYLKVWDEFLAYFIGQSMMELKTVEFWNGDFAMFTVLYYGAGWDMDSLSQRYQADIEFLIKTPNNAWVYGYLKNGEMVEQVEQGSEDFRERVLMFGTSEEFEDLPDKQQLGLA